MRTLVRSFAILFVGAVLFLLGVAAYSTVRALAREHPEVRLATIHSSLSRESCIDCHAPIAAKWRESFHFHGVTGPFWKRVRTEGYAGLFKTLRVPCMNCQAPGNVVDLPEGGHPVARTRHGTGLLDFGREGGSISAARGLSDLFGGGAVTTCQPTRGL